MVAESAADRAGPAIPAKRARGRTEEAWTWEEGDLSRLGADFPGVLPARLDGTRFEGFLDLRRDLGWISVSGLPPMGRGPEGRAREVGGTRERSGSVEVARGPGGVRLRWGRVRGKGSSERAEGEREGRREGETPFQGIESHFCWRWTPTRRNRTELTRVLRSCRGLARLLEETGKTEVVRGRMRESRTLHKFLLELASVADKAAFVARCPNGGGKLPLASFLSLARECREVSGEGESGREGERGRKVEACPECADSRTSLRI